MRKILGYVLVVACLLGAVDSYGLSITWNNWTDGVAGANADKLYNYDGTRADATDVFDTWNFTLYAHAGTATDVDNWASAGNFAPLSGSVVWDTTTWTDLGTSFGGMTIETVKTTTATPEVGQNLYIYFTDDDASHSGFVWGSDPNWFLTDDGSGASPQVIYWSKADFGGSGNALGGTLLGSPTDGWAAINPVPEPGTMVLFAIGMLTMGARMKRKKD